VAVALRLSAAAVAEAAAVVGAEAAMAVAGVVEATGKFECRKMRGKHLRIFGLV
jgi:hypothetical protein